MKLQPTALVPCTESRPQSFCQLTGPVHIRRKGAPSRLTDHRESSQIRQRGQSFATPPVPRPAKTSITRRKRRSKRRTFLTLMSTVLRSTLPIMMTMARLLERKRTASRRHRREEGTQTTPPARRRKEERSSRRRREGGKGRSSWSTCTTRCTVW